MNKPNVNMRQLTASEASKDEMERHKAAWEFDWDKFRAWWMLPEQDDLRKSCGMGWGFHIWQAALKSKQGVV